MWCISQVHICSRSKLESEHCGQLGTGCDTATASISGSVIKVSGANANTRPLLIVHTLGPYLPQRGEECVEYILRIPEPAVVQCKAFRGEDDDTVRTIQTMQPMPCIAIK